MVYIKVLCPDCGSDNVVFYGKNKDKQRLKCQNEECSRQTFQLEYSYNAYNPGIKQQVVDMTMNGSGTRDIGRVLGISKDTVTSVLKKQKLSPAKSTKTTSGYMVPRSRLT